MNKGILIGVWGAVLIAAVAAIIWWSTQSNRRTSITNYNECVQAGFPVMESYPPGCRTSDGRTFTQEIGNELEKQDMIRVAAPRPNATVTHPLIITGEARGTWFFEASFPIHLENAAGTNITTAIAQAHGEWMTTEFVPFTAALNIPDTFSGSATLVLEKDNPSGLPEHADALRIPIIVAELQHLK